MKYSKETLKLAEMCWSGNEIRCTKVLIGENYTDRDDEKVKYKITEDTYQELLKYQEVAKQKFKVSRVGNDLNLIGVLKLGGE